MGNELPQYRASNANKVGADGIPGKASDQAKLCGRHRKQPSAYKIAAPALMTLRGVHNLYLAGLTIRNPAFHGVMALSQKYRAQWHGSQTFDGNNTDGVSSAIARMRWIFQQLL